MIKESQERKKLTFKRHSLKYPFENAYAKPLSFLVVYIRCLFLKKPLAKEKTRRKKHTTYNVEKKITDY